jgi:hypothetical protein
MEKSQGMTWLLIVAAAGAGVVSNYFQKHLAAFTSPAAILGVNFPLALFLASVGVFLFGDREAMVIHPVVLAIGAVNVIAAYLYLHAIRHELAKTTVLAPVMLLTSVLFSAIFLGEWSLLDPRQLPGLLRLAGAVCAAVALALLQAKGTPKKNTTTSSWFSAALLSMVIWGVTNFLIKLFTVAAMPAEAFILSWYTGTAIAAVFLFSYRVRLRDVAGHFPSFLLLALVTVGSMALFYAVAARAPGVLLFPAHDVLKHGGTLFVGLFLFSERKKINSQEWAGMGIGVLALFSFIAASAL